MADTTRISIFERASSSVFSVVSIAVVIGGCVMWFGKLESSQAAVQAAEIVTTARIDRIEESRTIGLQRLSRTEEAVAGLQATLNRMDAKLDALRGR